MAMVWCETMLASNCTFGGEDRSTYYLVALHSVTAIGSIFGNSLVIFVVIRFSFLRTPTNYFVTSLAIADLIVGLSLPYYISFYFDVSYTCEKYPCLIRVAWSLFGALWSLLLMIGVAVDRYLAVLHPLHYSAWMSPCRVTRFSVATGVYMAAIVCLPLVSDIFNRADCGIAECDIYYIFTPAYAGPAVLFHIALAFVVTTVLYSKIFIVAWRQKKAHKAMNLYRVRRERKITKMMVLIFGVSVLALFPYFIVVCVRYAIPCTGQTSALSEIKKYCVVFFFAKSVMNPFIYGWRNKDFRLAFSRILRCSAKIKESKPRDQISTVPPSRLRGSVLQ